MTQYAYAPNDVVDIIGPDIAWVEANFDPSVWALFEVVADDVRLLWVRDGPDFVPPPTVEQKATKRLALNFNRLERRGVPILVNDEEQLGDNDARAAFSLAATALLSDDSLENVTMTLGGVATVYERDFVLFVWGSGAADWTAVDNHAKDLAALIDAISDAETPEDAVALLDAIDIDWSEGDYGDWPAQLSVYYPAGAAIPPTRVSTFAVLVAQLTAARLRMTARPVTWGGVLVLPMDQASISNRDYLGEFLARHQNIMQPMMVEPFTGTAEIAGTVLTITARTAGEVGLGTVPTMAGIAAGTQIIGLIDGVGRVGTYRVNISQTLASTAMTAGGAFFREYRAGNGVPLYLPNAAGGYQSIDADNYLGTISGGGTYNNGLSDDTFVYLQDINYAAFVLWNSLTVAYAIVDEQDSIDAMDAIEPDIDDPVSWPDTTIP